MAGTMLLLLLRALGKLKGDQMQKVEAWVELMTDARLGEWRRSKQKKKSLKVTGCGKRSSSVKSREITTMNAGKDMDNDNGC